MMNIYLINLARSHERLARMDGIFSSLGLSYSRIEAVDGRALAGEELDRLNATYPRPDGGRWRPGKIGCYLSHAKVWELVAGANEPVAAVFEDDLHVSPAIVDMVSAEDWIPSQADLVRLEATGHRLKLAREAGRISGRSIRRVLTASWGSAAYILSKAAAHRLHNTPPAYFSVDFILFNKKGSALARDLNVFQVTPAPCIQDIFLRDPELRVGLASEITLDNRDLRKSAITSFAGATLGMITGRRRIEFR